MHKRIHANWLKAYLEHTKYSEAPEMLHFWTGVSTIAGALRRRVWMDELYFQWTPNFYIILVGPPGIVTKSTSLSLGTRLLHEVPNIHFGPTSMTWQALLTALAEATELVPLGEQGALEDIQRTPMSCITCSISELGTFLKPKDDDLVDVLTDLWDGRLGPAWKRATRTQGSTDIENPWINVIGATTPAWLQRNFPEYLVGGGLTSRCMFIYAEQKRHYMAYPSESINPKVFEKEEQLLVEDLCRIADMKGEYKRSEDATSWGQKWYEDHWKNRPAHMASDRYGGYVARKQTHIHKLAMVLAAAQSDKLIITQKDLETAATFVTCIEADMSKVFESIGVADGSDKVREVVAVIRVYKEISQKDLYRHVMNTVGSIRQFEEVAASAERAGFIRKVQKDKRWMYYPTGA